VSYEKRIGQRIEVGDMHVRWSQLHARGGQPKRRSRRHSKSDVDHEDAYLRNVSASGAGIVARADESVASGTAVEVHVDAEASFVGRVRRIVPTTDPGFWFYGVEIAEGTEAFRAWLNSLLDAKRDTVITESHWRSAL
jgi:hypothetical protein